MRPAASPWCRAPPSVRSRRPSAACRERNQRPGDDEVHLVGSDAATTAFEDNGFQGSRPEVLRPLSRLSENGKAPACLERQRDGRHRPGPAREAGVRGGAARTRRGGAGGDARRLQRLLLTLPGDDLLALGAVLVETFTGVGSDRPTWRPRRRGHSSRSLPTESRTRPRPRPCCPGTRSCRPRSCPWHPGCSGRWPRRSRSRRCARRGSLTTPHWPSRPEARIRRRRGPRAGDGLAAAGARSAVETSLGRAARDRRRGHRRHAPAGHAPRRGPGWPALSVPLLTPMRVRRARVRECREIGLRLFAHRARRGVRDDDRGRHQVNPTTDKSRAGPGPGGGRHGGQRSGTWPDTWPRCRALHRSRARGPRGPRPRAGGVGRLPDVAVRRRCRLRRSTGPGPPSRACAGRASGSCRSGCAGGRRGCRRRSGTCTSPGARGSTRSARPRSPSCPA